MMLSVVLLTTLMALLSTLKFDQASDLWLQREFAFELESDVQDTEVNF